MTDDAKLQKLTTAVQLLLEQKQALAILYGPDAEHVFEKAPELANALGSLARPLQYLMQTMREIS